MEKQIQVTVIRPHQASPRVGEEIARGDTSDTEEQVPDPWGGEGAAVRGVAVIGGQGFFIGDTSEVTPAGRYQWYGYCQYRTVSVIRGNGKEQIWRPGSL